MLSTNQVSFTSSFSIWMFSISFSFLIGLARTASTMLNRNGENGQSSLFSMLGVIQSFIINHVSCRFSKIPFLRLKKFPLFLIC